MRASLADQHDKQLSRLAATVAQALHRPDTLAIALGANLPSPALASPALPSPASEPADTLLAVRPQLEQLLAPIALRFHWSPLLQTAPVGGPPGQPPYCNGVLLVELSAAAADASAAAVAQPPAHRSQQSAALNLLQGLQALEAHYGRPPQQEREHWGPRSLDLDLLWWGTLELNLPATAATPALQLPHPLWRQRSFVLEPLAALIAQPQIAT